MGQKNPLYYILFNKQEIFQSNAHQFQKNSRRSMPAFYTCAKKTAIKLTHKSFVIKRKIIIVQKLLWKSHYKIKPQKVLEKLKVML